MSAQKPLKSGLAGGIITFVVMSVIAAVLIAASVTPAIAVTGLTANSTLGIFDNLPSYIQLDNLAQKSSIYATGSDGKPVLMASFYAQDREEVEYKDISKYATEAAIATEDPRFYEHGGIDINGTLRAVLTNAVGGDVQGGSSITQQYVKNVLVQKAEAISDPVARKKAYNEAIVVSIDRKLKEMKLAIGMEQKYSKQQILTGYLNISSFGGRVYGIQSAAKYYFGVDAKDLTLPQAASLIAMVQNPNNLRIDMEENLQDNKDRRNYVLKRMKENGYITDKEYQAAIKTPVEPKITPASTGCQTAPAGGAYFCDYITWVIKNDKTFGKTADERWAAFQRGGWQIMSSMNMQMQEVTNSSVRNAVPPIVDGADIGSTAVSVEVGTGRILSMASSKDYSNDPEVVNTGANYTSVNYATDKEYGGSSGFQVGSTYKVFTLAEWLKSGHGLGEMVNGAKRDIQMDKFTNSCQGVGGPVWRPVNDGGGGGPVSVLSATAQSVNLAFISMAMQLDLCKIRKTAEAFLVHRADNNVLDSNPSSVLGTNEIAPLTMADAFAGIANGGKVCTPIAIDAIKDLNGKSLTPPKTKCTQAVNTDVANAMVRALKGPIQSGTATRSNPRDGIPIIGKTGSTDDYVHTWMVGSTTKVATAVWVGNVQGFARLTGLRINGVTGNLIRHDIFRPIMQTANALFGGSDWAAPPASMLGGKSATVPDVKGLSVEDAKKLIESVGLTYKDGGVVDGEIANGKVQSSDPAGGSSVPTATEITVYISNGTLVAGPISTVGMTLVAAQTALSGWTVNVVHQAAPQTCTAVTPAPTPTVNPSPTPTQSCVPGPNPDQGKIVAQTPNGGFVKPGVTVTITVQD